MLQGIEPALHRHVHIKRDHVGLQLQRFFNTLPAVASGAYDFKTRVRANLSQKRFAHECRVVDHKNPDTICQDFTPRAGIIDFEPSLKRFCEACGKKSPLRATLKVSLRRRSL
jgi:hypothetical protein